MPNTYARAAAEGMPIAEEMNIVGRFSRRALLAAGSPIRDCSVPPNPDLGSRVAPQSA